MRDMCVCDTLCPESMGRFTMSGTADLSAAQWLALIAVNFGPLKRCTDGRWRSGWQDFPASGLGDAEIHFLSDNELAEVAQTGAILTEKGRFLIRDAGAVGELPATPARAGMHAVPSLLQ